MRRLACLRLVSIVKKALCAFVDNETLGAVSLEFRAGGCRYGGQMGEALLVLPGVRV